MAAADTKDLFLFRRPPRGGSFMRWLGRNLWKAITAEAELRRGRRTKEFLKRSSHYLRGKRGVMWQIAVQETSTVRSLGLTGLQPSLLAEGAHVVLSASLFLAGKRVIHLDNVGARGELEKVRRALHLYH